MSITPRYTSRDLELLPEVEGVRYEIIDGELHVSKMPRWEHQYTSNAVGSALHVWDTQTGRGITMTAPGLVFAEDDDVAPDIVWVSQERLDVIVDEGGHFRAAPDLVVEVLSPGSRNERRDRELKLKLYSRQGVREYWIVDWRGREVQIYRRQDAALRLVSTLGSDDTLTSSLLPGFACAVVDLWPRSPGKPTVK